MAKKSKKQMQTAQGSGKVENKNAKLNATEMHTTTVSVVAEVINTVSEQPISTPLKPSESCPAIDESKSSNAEELKQEAGKKKRNRKKKATSNETKADQVKQSEVAQDNVCSAPGVTQAEVKPDTNVNHDKDNSDSTHPVDLVKTSKVAEAQEASEKDGAVVRMGESSDSNETEKKEGGKKKRNKKKADPTKEISNTAALKMENINQVEVQPKTCQKVEVPKLDAVTAKQDVNSASQIQQKTVENVVTNSQDEPKQAVEVTSEQDIKIDGEVAAVVSEGGDKPNTLEEEKVQKRKCYSHSLLLEILKTTTLVKPQLRCLELATVTPNSHPVVHERPQQSSTSKWASMPIDRSQRKAFLGIDHENVVLHKSSAAWQTTRKEASKDEVDSVVQKLRGLLNKLSPENFGKILSDIKALSFDTLGKLVGFIKVLFEKAVMEPGFSPTYARLALNVSGLSVEEGGKSVSFRTLLIRECQTEFEKDKADEKILSELTEKIRVAKTEAEKKLLTEEKQMAVFKTKKRSLGNIKFIGELFKMNILSEAIMITCINKLLQKPEDEESMECMCKLLSTIGKTIDSKSKTKVDSLMNELDQLQVKKTASSRIRFMIMDVIDLRKSGWVPKRNEVPTTIAEVHRLAASEKQHGATYDNRPSYKTSTLGRSTGHYQAKKEAVNSVFQDFFASNMKQGKDVKKAKKDVDKVKKPKTDGKKLNKFDALLNLCADKDEEKPQKKKSVKHLPEIESPGTEEKSFENVNRVEPENLAETVSASPDEKVIPRREMELKVKSRIDEFLSLKDTKEALESIKELNTEACHTNAVRFFYISFSQNLEKSSVVRGQIGLLHRNVLEKRIAPVEAYVDASIKFSTFANDMVVDIPQVWTYISELVTPVVLDSELIKLEAFARGTTSADAELDEDLSGEEGAYTAMLLAAILNGVSSTNGKEAAEQLWTDAGLNWESLLKHGTLEEEFRQKYLKI